MLTKTMKKLKADLIDLKNYVKKNCKSVEASEHLIGILLIATQDLEVIDLYIKNGKYLSALDKIANHIMPRKDGFYQR